LWHPSSGQPPLLLHAHSQPISALACSPDGSLLASASEDHTVAIWHTPSGRLLRRYTSHSYKVVALAWSPDGSRIASADDEGLIHLWNPLTGKTLLTKPFEHECWSPSLAWSPDGSRLAVTAWSDLLPPTISIWQADTFQPLLHYYGHHHDIYAVSWSPDGSLIASLSSDSPNDPPASSILHLWDPSSGRLLHRWPCHAFLAPVWSPDGSLLAFEGLQGLEIRSVRPGLPLLFLPASSPCAWSPDGSLLASLSPFSVDLWPVSTLLS
ncbi:MAG: PD40 domain-containing protein, partial [Thermogemmatispora sp.]